MKKTMKSFVSIVLAFALVASIGVMAFANMVTYYEVDFNLSNGLEKISGLDVADENTEYKAKIGVRSSYKSTHTLPDTIEISINGDILSPGDFSYDDSTGEIIIPATTLPPHYGEAPLVLITAAGVGDRGGNGDDLPPADPIEKKPVVVEKAPEVVPEVIENPTTGARA